LASKKGESYVNAETSTETSTETLATQTNLRIKHFPFLSEKHELLLFYNLGVINSKGNTCKFINVAKATIPSFPSKNKNK